MSLNAFVYIATSLGEGEIHKSGELVLLKTHKNKVSHQGDRTVFKAYSSFFFSKKVNQKRLEEQSRNNKSKKNAAMVISNLSQA